MRRAKSPRLPKVQGAVLDGSVLIGLSNNTVLRNATIDNCWRVYTKAIVQNGTPEHLIENDSYLDRLAKRVPNAPMPRYTAKALRA